jgi:putative Mn2+ efflux pump MntP
MHLLSAIFLATASNIDNLAINAAEQVNHTPHLLSAIFLAIASNIDNFAVGIAYGVKKIKIGSLTNLFIALVSAAGTYLSISVGKDISRYLPLQTANVLGSVLLVGVGVWSIWKIIKYERKRLAKKAKIRQQAHMLVASGLDETMSAPSISFDNSAENISPKSLPEFSYEKFLEHPEKADTDRSGYIDVTESIALAFGLTLNNLGAGVGAGISDLSAVFTSFLVLILSLVGISSGYFLGDRIHTKISGFWAGVSSGIIIILIGVYEYFIP